jgi:hypothetical protein
MSHLSRLTLAGAVAVISLAGCAHKPETKSTTVTSTHTTASTPVSTSSSTSSATPRRGTGATNPTTNSKLPDRTGISACDDYLSSYLSCHRAANIYAPNQLQGRYEAMRTSLLRDSQDPDIRPQLAARCNSLASQLRDALHGKSCDANAAPASTSP